MKEFVLKILIGYMRGPKTILGEIAKEYLREDFGQSGLSLVTSLLTVIVYCAKGPYRIIMILN